MDGRAIREREKRISNERRRGTKGLRNGLEREEIRDEFRSTKMDGLIGTSASELESCIRVCATIFN